MRWLPVGRRERLRSVLLWVAFLLLLAAAAWWMTGMPGRSHSGPLPPLSDAEVDLRRRLEGHVRVLAGEIGERNVWRPQQLAAAARYIEEQLAGSGHSVLSEHFTVGSVAVRNLVVERRGLFLPDEIVVVGAHYDSVMGSPGANDNATGVAALLEIARGLVQARPGRTVRCAFFVNEEPPFYLTEEMGSLVHARRAGSAARGSWPCCPWRRSGTTRTRSAASTIPYLSASSIPGGATSSASSATSAREAWCGARSRRSAGAPHSRPRAWPHPVGSPGIGWSDHWSFWQHGYPGVMVTDTALFRYGLPHERGHPGQGGLRPPFPGDGRPGAGGGGSGGGNSSLFTGKPLTAARALA
jgi:hypothetical protein